jgi:hypothetical protein
MTGHVHIAGNAGLNERSGILTRGRCCWRLWHSALDPGNAIKENHAPECAFCLQDGDDCSLQKLIGIGIFWPLVKTTA